MCSYFRLASQIFYKWFYTHVNLLSSALKYVAEKVAAPVAAMASGDIAVHKSAPAALAGNTVAEVVALAAAVAVLEIAAVAVFHLLMVL